MSRRFAPPEWAKPSLLGSEEAAAPSPSISPSLDPGVYSRVNYIDYDDLEDIMYTIGKVARLAGVSTDTLRYYEKEGLIMPASKTAAGYRLYNDETVRRIRFVKHAQHCGFTLAEIQELLKVKAADNACCQDVRSLAIEKKLRIEHKLRALQAMSRALDELIERCDDGGKTIDECPILHALENNLGVPVK